MYNTLHYVESHVLVFVVPSHATLTAPISPRCSTGGLPRTAVIGVLGGGQLGRMMAIAAANMDVKIKVRPMRSSSWSVQRAANRN